MSGLAIVDTIFRAYDIRGVVGSDLTAATMEVLGRAIGSEARERGRTRIAVARDGRASGVELAGALREGLLASGMEVLDVGRGTTPLLYFAALAFADGNGAMVTGSHNPPAYNGVKIMLDGRSFAGDEIQGLRRRLAEGRLSAGCGCERQSDPRPDYLARLTAEGFLDRPLRVVVDAGNGVAGELAPQALRQLGCDVVELFCEVDGRFPNHHPDPSRPENLAALRQAVTVHGADVGLAFDGDGDRLGVVAPGGDIIWPDRLLILFARDLLQRVPGATVVSDVKCSGQVGRAVTAAGGRAVMAATGHSLMKARMLAEDALLGGELTGHFYFRDRWAGFDDGLYAAIRLLQIVARAADPAALFAGLPDSVNTPELHVSLAEGQGAVFMAEVERRLDAFGDARLTRVDGVRADWPFGWGLLRASNTTPALVLRFEAEDRPGLNRIQEIFRVVMRDIQADIDLPF